ncbi:MAG: hypothetical protein U0T36_07600 [Saprospiraceae bacterium]
MKAIKNIITFLVFHFMVQGSFFAQNCASLSGIINTYAPVSSISGNVVTIGATSGATAPFAVGDYVVFNTDDRHSTSTYRIQYGKL